MVTVWPCDAGDVKMLEGATWQLKSKVFVPHMNWKLYQFYRPLNHHPHLYTPGVSYCSGGAGLQKETLSSYMVSYTAAFR